MSVPNYYKGPGQVYFNGISIPPNGINGTITHNFVEKKTDRANAMVGEGYSTLDDQYVETSLTPFDRWALLPTLFPAWLGVTTNAGSGSWSAGGSGALVIGTNPFDPTNAGTKYPLDVWTPDGRLYQTVRAALVKVPQMRLGNGQPLYEQCQFLSIGDPAVVPGGSSFIYASNAITETGASNPDSAGFLAPDFLNGHWTAAWGAISGFTALEAEDYWTLVPDVKYDVITVQKLSRTAKLASARFMIKGRILGPSQTQLLGKITAHTLGGQLVEGSSTDLVLSGPSSKTITLKNCEVFGAPFEFGGTRLGIGEIGFVSNQIASGGAIQPQLIFSS